uniref:Uncharacterized protein n=1 Tax=Rhizophora mucronata TaxID=61149 RepID=A0A2P2IJS3_RHIMU
MCCSTLPPFCFQICPLRAGGGKGVMRCFQWHGVEDILILCGFLCLKYIVLFCIQSSLSLVFYIELGTIFVGFNFSRSSRPVSFWVEESIQTLVVLLCSHLNEKMRSKGLKFVLSARFISDKHKPRPSLLRLTIIIGRLIWT